MLTKLVLCITLSFMAGCAPMPGNVLFKGLEHPTPLANERITTHIGVIESTRVCNRLLAEQHNYKPLVLNCVLNACVIFGCAEVHWDSNGDINTCDVYLAWDIDSIRKHELRHCKGYDDVLY